MHLRQWEVIQKRLRRELRYGPIDIEIVDGHPQPLAGRLIEIGYGGAELLDDRGIPESWPGLHHPKMTDAHGIIFQDQDDRFFFVPAAQLPSNFADQRRLIDRSAAMNRLPVSARESLLHGEYYLSHRFHWLPIDQFWHARQEMVNKLATHLFPYRGENYHHAAEHSDPRRVIKELRQRVPKAELPELTQISHVSNLRAHAHCHPDIATAWFSLKSYAMNQMIVISLDRPCPICSIFFQVTDGSLMVILSADVFSLGDPINIFASTKHLPLRYLSDGNRRRLTHTYPDLPIDN